MAKKKKTDVPQLEAVLDEKTHILGAGEIVNQEITDTLKYNFMPYAMSIILSRAIPEIDGFKPSHRKILYMMYKMGLLNGPKAKSAKIVGQVMQLNPHGDAAIYDAMVRLSRGYDALLHPYIESKGNFGKAYSKDMMWAASRYTEAKLEKICTELFSDIDKDTVDMVDNFDNSMKEPTLLPVTFPSVLVNSNTGIAAGMASSICSFNLEEVCKTTIELLKNPKHDCTETLLAPDFSGGGILLYNKEAIEEIYNTGRGSVKIRGKYSFDKKNSCIEITEIPPTTTIEAIIDKVIERVKTNSLKEINDIRDETDLSGLKITIDVKRGTDPEKLMNKLYAITPLEDSFSANFNILVNGTPKVMGVCETLLEWISFRTECIKRRTQFDINRNEEKLHLLKGLEKILVDIDKAIKIIRNTEEDAMVIPNLMIGFKIDEVQADFVANIRLRNLNKEYILKRLDDIKKLELSIKQNKEIIESPKKIKKIIIFELNDVIKKYGKPRNTEILYSYNESLSEPEDEVEEYPVTLFFTREGYFKKVTPASLRMSTNQNLKETDEIILTVEANNTSELLFFTNKCQVYKAIADNFEDTKISLLGDYVAAKLEMDEGEVPIHMLVTDSEYDGYVMFFYENGKSTKVELSAYKTITNRKKLIKAYSDKSPIRKIIHLTTDQELVVISSAGRHLLINTAVINPKKTKDSIGVNVMSLKKGQTIFDVRDYRKGEFAKPYRYRAKNLPATGALLTSEDSAEQITFE